MAVQRVEIPISFQYQTLVYTASSAGGATTQATTVLQPPPVNTPVTVTDTNTNNPATVYLNPTGSTTITSPATDAGGNVNGWVVEGSYKFIAASGGGFAGATVYWNAVRGDGIENIYPGSITTVDIANAAITNPLLASAVAQALVPTGTILEFGGTSAPAGYLLCNGAVVSQTTYAGLYSVIGSTFNAGGEGTGNFRLPDFRQRFALGKAASGTGSSLGGTGGHMDHTHHVEDIDIDVLDVGRITIRIIIPGHQHNLHGGGAAIFIREDPDGRSTMHMYHGPHDSLTYGFDTRHNADLADRPILLSTTETHRAAQLLGQTDSDGGATIDTATDHQVGQVGLWDPDDQTIKKWKFPHHDTDTENPPFLVVNKIIKT